MSKGNKGQRWATETARLHLCIDQETYRFLTDYGARRQQTPAGAAKAILLHFVMDKLENGE